jgi:hypothetical protein
MVLRLVVETGVSSSQVTTEPAGNLPREKETKSKFSLPDLRASTRY